MNKLDYNAKFNFITKSKFNFIMRFIYFNILVFYFAFVFLTPAHAYIDPGTVSIVLQSILAAIAGVAATYRLWISKIKSFFKKKNLEK